MRVYFEDTDFSGLVYHGSYVRWCERGRSDFLRLLGSAHSALLTGSEDREPAAFVVKRMQFEFHKPARIDDVLEVTTRTREIGPAHIGLEQRIVRDGVEITSADVLVVLVSLSGKPQRLSHAIKQAFSPVNAC